MGIIVVHDIVEENGKTVKENNLAKQHLIPLGTLVEITYENEFEEPEDRVKGLRLFVVNHSRDCDGTPLYDLSLDLKAHEQNAKYKQQLQDRNFEEPVEELLVQALYWKTEGMLLRHYGPESIKVVEPEEKAEPAIPTKTKQVMDVQDWDELVTRTYGRHYQFQQQDDCRERGIFELTVPAPAEDFPRDTIPEKINGSTMGVSFAAWLARDPTEWNGLREHARYLDMFWGRNFYPDVQMVANDLHAKGLLPAGEYVIDIDW